MIRVDGHVHFDFMGFSQKRMIKWMDKRRVDYCWALTWEEYRPADSAGYQPLPIETIAAATLAYPDRIVPFFAPDPAAPDAIQRLRDWSSRGVRGCGELKVNARWDSADVGALLDEVQQLGMPLVFHMQDRSRILQPSGRLELLLRKLVEWPRCYGVTGMIVTGLRGVVPSLERRIARMSVDFPGYLLDFASLEARLVQYPGIRFVAHGPLFWSELWRESPARRPELSIPYQLLERYQNLYADISAGSGYDAITRAPAFTRELFLRFPDRIIFGSDNYLYDWDGFIDTLKLPATVRDDIMGGNAYRVLGPPAGAIVA